MHRILYFEERKKNIEMLEIFQRKTSLKIYLYIHDCILLADISSAQKGCLEVSYRKESRDRGSLWSDSRSERFLSPSTFR